MAGAGSKPEGSFVRDGNIDDSYLVGRVKRGERIRSAYGADDSQTYDDKGAAQKSEWPETQGLPHCSVLLFNDQRAGSPGGRPPACHQNTSVARRSFADGLIRFGMWPAHALSSCD